MDETPIPQLLKELIEKCWDVDPQKRPTIIDLQETIENWYKYDEEINIGELEEDTEFYRQYQTIEEEYNTFSQTTPYKIHPTTVLCSKPIDTKQITELLKNLPKTEQTSSQLTKIIEQIKEKEEEIKELKKSLSGELTELIDKFIEVQKKPIKDGKSEEIIKLKEKMKEKGLSRKKRDEFIRYCEDLTKLEQQKQQMEEEQVQLQIEVPIK